MGIFFFLWLLLYRLTGCPAIKSVCARMFKRYSCVWMNVPKAEKKVYNIQDFKCHFPPYFSFCNQLIIVLVLISLSCVAINEDVT